MSKQQLVAVELNTKEDFENYNIREKLKKAQRPYDYYKHIKDLDYEQLADSDRYFLQDFGIYNNSLNDDEFMLRLRFPAGRITSEQLKAIASICNKYDLTIILTARAGMQLHGLEAHNVYEAYKEVEKANMNTWQSFGDNVRNITTDIFDGVGKHNIIEVYPYIKQMQDYILKNPEYVGLLPRRLSIGISGSYANGSSFFASDIYFALAKKDDTYGFNVYLGGKNTEIAQDANIFLEKEEILDFYKTIIKVFYLHGLRLDRERNRLYHLLEEIGLDKFVSLLEEEYKSKFNSKGDIQLEKVEFEDFNELKDGTYSFCYHSKFAKLEANEVLNISEYCLKNSLETRIGTDQQLYILNLKEKKIDLEHDNINRTIVACAGSEYCPYAYWTIKDEVQYLPLNRIQKNKILVGFSGCLRGCAKHEHSDIGIVGLKSNYLGNREKTARIYLGALYTEGKALARRVFNTIPLTNLKEILEIIIEEYEESKYKTFESFSQNVLNKYSIEFLNLWVLSKFKTKKKVYLDSFDEKEILNKYFKEEESIQKYIDDFDSAIKLLSKELWVYKETQEDIKLNKTYVMEIN